MMRYLLIVIALFLSSSAFAKEIDFSELITDQDGVQIMDCAGVGCSGPPLTLGIVSLRALTAQFDDDKNLSGEDKFKRGELALRVYKGGVIDLTAEDIATIKKLVAKGYGPLIVVKAWMMLDPQSAKGHASK